MACLAVLSKFKKKKAVITSTQKLSNIFLDATNVHCTTDIILLFSQKQVKMLWKKVNICDASRLGYVWQSLGRFRYKSALCSVH